MIEDIKKKENNVLFLLIQALNVEKFSELIKSTQKLSTKFSEDIK